MGCTTMIEHFPSEKSPQPELPPESLRAFPVQPASPLRYPDDDLNRQSLKQHMEQFQLWLAEAFNSGQRAEELVDARSLFIDQLLQRLWTFYGSTILPKLPWWRSAVMVVVNCIRCLILTFWC